MRRIKLYQKLVPRGQHFEFWLPGLSENIAVLPRQKIEIEVTESNSGHVHAGVFRVFNDPAGYRVRSDEWLPD